MLNHNHISPKNDAAISNIEDIIPTSTYEELSLEFQKVYPYVSRAIQLIELMYNRLTLKDNLSHKEAVSRIHDDHKHLQGFSQRNIRRSLMSLDNPKIPHRTGMKIRPSWPNSIDIDDRENTELPYKSSVGEQNPMLGNDLTRKTECSNCNLLLLQTQKLEKEKSKVVEGYDQALQIIKEQAQRIVELQGNKTHSNQPVTSIDDVLEKEMALLFEPLRQAMASAFRLKENKLWLTIRFSKNTGSIVTVYTGRKSDVAKSSRSILSSGLGCT
jgi:hypothetical protein